MRWYKKYLDVFEIPPQSIPTDIVDCIKQKIDMLHSKDPVVSVVVIAHNEESRLMACLWSLSNFVTDYPYEIIGVDNNSTDSTSDLFKSAGVRYFWEDKKGPGHARQKGLEMSRGKYILCIDSDTLYPPYYLDEMVRTLSRTGVASVTASYSYVPTKGYPRFWMSIYERFRDIHLYFLSFRNPVWCVRGAVFAHLAEPAKQIGGYRVHLERGEDGAMAFDLMEYGRLVFKRGGKTRAYTSTKALGYDGIVKAFLKRAMDSIMGLRRYFFFTGDSDEIEKKKRENL